LVLVPSPGQFPKAWRGSGGAHTLLLPGPVAGDVLPDITVFGEYTYLVTELMWGTVALVLLAYAGAWRSAARTVAVLYPFAFVWDWYTLTVGVFEISRRTGVELLGIPLEEHIFILLVPAMVVGTHESLQKLFGPAGGEAEAPARARVED
jgi:lycopene cyclase domain-containing protein